MSDLNSILRRPHLAIVALVLLFAGIAVIAANPSWWSLPHASDPAAPTNLNIPPVLNGALANNKGPATIGQAKHMVISALLELDKSAPQIATSIRADLTTILDLSVPNTKTPAWIEKQKAPLLLGQLKAIALPFYNRLNTLHPQWVLSQIQLAQNNTAVIGIHYWQAIGNAAYTNNGYYPWNPQPLVGINNSIATIGQVKAVFSLRFDTLSLGPIDSDGDGMTDVEEITGGYSVVNNDSNNNGINDGYDDDDHDGYPNHVEIKAATNPRDASSKPDGVATDTLLVTNFSATSKQRAASFSKTEFRAFVPSPNVNGNGRITADHYKFYNYRNIERQTTVNSSYTSFVDRPDGGPSTHQMISGQSLYSETTLRDYLVKQNLNGEYNIFQRLYTEQSDNGTDNRTSETAGEVSGGRKLWSIASTTYFDGNENHVISESGIITVSGISSGDTSTQTYTLGPNSYFPIEYASRSRLPSEPPTPSGLWLVWTEEIESSQTLETVEALGSYEQGGPNPINDKVFELTNTTLDIEFTDDSLSGLVLDLLGKTPYTDLPANERLVAKFKFDDDPDGSRDLSITDLKYKFSTNVGPNVKKIVFLWKDVTALGDIDSNQIPIQTGPNGSDDGSGTPKLKIKWMTETVFNNSANPSQKIETKEYALDHPSAPGVHYIQGTENISLLAPQIIGVDHDTKSTDAVPSNLWSVSFNSPPDLIERTVTLTATGAAEIQLWEKISTPAQNSSGNSTTTDSYQKRSLPYTLKGEQKAGVGSIPGQFFIQGKKPGNLSLKLNGPNIVLGEQEVRVIDIDLDIDSDNTGGIDHSDREDQLESLNDEKGKLVFFNSRSDSDNDQIPNFADMDHAGYFTPLTVKAANLLATDTIRFFYPPSAPDKVQTFTDSEGRTTYLPAPGLSTRTLMRIWKKDGETPRALSDYIAPDKNYTLSDLGITPGAEKTFFIEAIESTEPAGPAGITISSMFLSDRVMVSLLPVDIKVVKEGEISAPEDGLIVKKTDTVRYRLSPGMPDTPLLFEDKIQWHWRILKWDGTYSPWTGYTNGRGHTFTAQPQDAGIYEVKATMEGQDFFLKRAKDDPHSAKKKDENECFGVVEKDWQINVRNQAKGNLGSVAYAKAVANDNVPKNEYKCNLFVGHKANDGGAAVPKINGNNPFNKYYPIANQWAGTQVATIPGWTLLPTNTYPQPGFVVARGAPGGIGHTGIVDYDGAWISAGTTEVNRKADVRTYIPSRFNKYTP